MPSPADGNSTEQATNVTNRKSRSARHPRGGGRSCHVLSSLYERCRAVSVIEKKSEPTAIGERVERLTDKHPAVSPATVADVVHKMHTKFDGRPSARLRAAVCRTQRTSRVGDTRRLTLSRCTNPATRAVRVVGRASLAERYLCAMRQFIYLACVECSPP